MTNAKESPRYGCSSWIIGWRNDDLQIWRAAANIAYFINSRGQPTMRGLPVSVLGEGLNSHSTSDWDRFLVMERTKIHMIVMGNPEGKRPLGKARRRWEVIFIHSYSVCLTTGPKRTLHTVRSRASSFKWEYPLLSLRSSSSFLRLLPRPPVTSIPSLSFLQ